MDSEVLLSVEDLVVSFSSRDEGLVHAVRGVSFKLHRGETLAVVGESGSGKSVTMKAVMGILSANGRVESGKILYDGLDLAKATEEQMHKIRGCRIGMVFQDPLSALDPIMKIGNQITEVLKKRGMSSAEATRKAISLLRDVGIDEPERRIEQYPFQFSGGMRQRIVIAIALAGDPEILICDEPTTALDVTVQARILELIKELQQKRGLSEVFITHDMGVVAQMADRIEVMYAGKIVEKGTTEEIFFHPAHPYTWALLGSMPDMETRGRLEAIPGAPPDMSQEIHGDAFAPRNPYALAIDFEREPPLFRLSETHMAATWLLHPKAPRIEMSESLRERIRRMKEAADEQH